MRCSRLVRLSKQGAFWTEQVQIRIWGQWNFHRQPDDDYYYPEDQNTRQPQSPPSYFLPQWPWWQPSSIQCTPHLSLLWASSLICQQSPALSLTQPVSEMLTKIVIGCFLAHQLHWSFKHHGHRFCCLHVGGLAVFEATHLNRVMPSVCYTLARGSPTTASRSCPHGPWSPSFPASFSFSCRFSFCAFLPTSPNQ